MPASQDHSWSSAESATPETSHSAQQIAERVKLLESAKAAYYNGSEPLMSDAEFDSLEEQLRKWQPEHPYFQTVGSKVGAAEILEGRSAAKIHHKIAMLSMDKAKQVAGVEAWFQRLLDNSQQISCKTPLCVQPKIDGISASCYYQNGKLEYIATRGDGRQGQDVSHIAPFVDDIPIDIAAAESGELRDFEVRGELYIPKNQQGTETGGRPLRNICAGLINRKAEKQADIAEELKQLRFIAYQCPQQRLDSSEYRQICALAELGFHTVEPKLCDISGIRAYAERYLNELRQTWQYETDGLIICIDESDLFDEIDALWVVAHHHHYAIALKPPAEGGTTLLCEVHWQLGRQGRLSPVAEFLPLTLASAVIERATLHNYANVKRLNLQRGDVLEVERAGDVIPYVRRNLGHAISLQQRGSLEYLSCRTVNCAGAGAESASSAVETGKLGTSAAQTGQPISISDASKLAEQIIAQHGSDIIPKQCPSCGGPLSEKGADLLCLERNCPEQVIQRTLFWVKQAKIEQVAEQSIRQLYKQGSLRQLQDLYRISEELLRKMPGYADKKIAKFLNELENSRHINVHQLVERLGIPMVQQKSLQKLGELRRKSRWENFLQLVGEKLAKTESKALTEDTLLQAMAEVAPAILHDWAAWDSPRAELFSCQLLEALLLILMPTSGPATPDIQAVSGELPLPPDVLQAAEKTGAQNQSQALRAAALLRLSKLWGTTTGRAEIWKRGFGAWQELLLGQQPDYLELRRIEDFSHFCEPQSRYSIMDSLNQWLACEENQILLEELLPVLDLQELGGPNVWAAKAKTVCMTGSGPLPRKQLQEQLELAGYQVTESLNKTTDILLCADPAASSSKLKKAAAWGIAVYSYHEFLQNL